MQDRSWQIVSAHELLGEPQSSLFICCQDEQAIDVIPGMEGIAYLQQEAHRLVGPTETIRFRDLLTLN